MKLRSLLTSIIAVCLSLALRAADSTNTFDLAGNALTGIPYSSGETYIRFPLPAVTGVSPSAGATTGGTSITLTGTGFTGATAVSFGGTAGTGLSVVNATTITVTAPAHAAGTVNITVTTPGGTSSTSASDQYVYAVAPSIGTPSKASVTDVSATLGGTITADGGASITERGIVIAITATNNDPTIGGSGVTKVAASGTSTGAFTTAVSGLNANTGYSYKAYATNSIGTSYSSVDTFSTNPPSPAITSAATASGTYGLNTFSYTIAATNSPTSFNATGLPSGLNVNTSTGVISGTPTETSGSPYSVTISATNGGGTGSATLTLTVNKKTLVVLASSQFSATTKVYDGTTAVLTLNKPGTVTFTGKYGSDDVAVDATNAVGTFASKDVGNRAATVSGLTLTGAASGNYTLSVVGSTPAVAITAKPLSVTGIAGVGRTYDGTNVATLSGTASLLDSQAAGAGNTGDGKPYDVDSVSLTGTPTVTFDSKDVGTAKPITVSGYAVTGTGNTNYTLTQPTGLTADVTQKALTITGLSAVATRVYDGTAVASLSGTPALLATQTAGAGTADDGKPYDVDSVSISGTPVGAFADRHVGNAKAITVSGLTVSGTGSGNYTATQTAGLTANVTAKALTVTGVSALSPQVYSGTTNATLGGTAAFLATEAAGAGTADDGKPYDVDSVTPSGTPAGTFADRHVGTAKTITVSGITVSGTGNSNYTVTQPTGLTADVTAKALSVTGVSAVASRVYDGTTVAGLSGTPAFLAAEAAGAGSTDDGKPYDVDSVAPSGTAAGAFADRHVGTTKAITVSGITVGGTGSGNYTVTQPTGLTAEVTAKALSVTGVSAVASRVYDGTTVAGLTGTPAFLPAEAAGAGSTSDGKPYDVDSVTPSGTAAGAFADRHVATAKAITVSGITLSGTGNGNYSVTQPTGLTADVTAKALTVSGVTATSPLVYSGTTAATLAGTPAFQAAIAAGSGTSSDGKPYDVDSVTPSGTPAGAFADRHVGSAKAITVSGIAVTGTGSDNYSVTQPTGLTADVTAKALSITGVSAVATRVYDGSTVAGLTGTPAFLAAEAAGAGSTSDGKPYDVDSITVSGTPAGAFADRHVGNAKAITVSGITIAGTGNTNYSVTQPAGLTADVTAKALTVTGVSAVATRVYDGSTVAGLTGTPAFLAAEAAGTGTSSDGKPYDVDSVAPSGTAAGAFADRHVGIAKAITVSGIAVAGTGSANYTVTQPTGLTANVTQKNLSVTGVSAVATRVYDGTAVAGLTGTPAFQAAQAAGAGTSTDGIPYSVDTISVGGTASGAFADRHVGSGKAITVSGLSVAGTDAANYSLTQPTGLTAAVTPKTLTSGGIVASGKVYDGTNVVPVSGTPVLQSSEAAGTGTTADGKPYSLDALSLGGTVSGVFADRHVGSNKGVTILGVTLGGTDAGNYSLTQPTGLTASISQKALDVVGLTGGTRIYDATLTAPITGTAALLASQAAGSGTVSDGKPYNLDAVSVTGTPAGVFASRHVGTGKPITVSGLTLAGTDAGNYSVTQPTSLTGTVTAKALTVSGVTANNKTYDASTTAVLVGTPALQATEAAGTGTTADGKPYAADDVSITGTLTGAFSDRHAGDTKTVTVSGLTLAGAEATNYTVSTLTTTANIAPKALTIGGVTASNRVYDGTTVAPLGGAPTLTTAQAVGVGSTADGVPYDVDTVTAGGTPAGAFADRHVATAKAITVTGVTLGGAHASNYSPTQPTGLTANVTVKTLTLSGLSATGRVYDGTTVVAIAGTPALQVAEAAGAGATDDGKPYSVDDVSVTGSALGAFADRHVAADKAVVVSGLGLGGAQASNYVVAPPTTLTASVTPKALSSSGVVGVARVYDGTTAAPLSGSVTLQSSEAAGSGNTADGKPYSNDTVGISGAAMGSFADRHVGTAKPIAISGIALSGAQADNYTLIAPVGVAADVTPKNLNIAGVTGTSRVYDATTVATLSGTAVLLASQTPGTGTPSDGKPYSGDTVTLAGSASASFATKVIGAAKAITVTGYSLAGAQAMNYTLTQPTGLTADVTAKALTVSGVTATSKSYDGDANATLVTLGAKLVGVAGSDDVTLVTMGATGTFASATAGQGKTVTITGLSISGADSGNYTLTQPSATASINQTIVGITLSNLTHTYDGTPKAVTVSTNPQVPTQVTYTGSPTPTNAGSYPVSVVVSDANYTGSANGTLTIAKATQTVTVSVGGTSTATVRPISASASSGLPVTLSVVSGAATLSGSTLTITGGGTITVRATQVGNENYMPASADTTTTGVATKQNQTITFGAISNHTANEPPFALIATASSGLPVRFTVSGPAIVNGNMLTLGGTPGAVTVTASQPGNEFYNPAPDVSQSFNVIAVGRKVYFGLTQNEDSIAIDLAPDGKSGTLLCYIGATGEAYIVTFTVNPDGTFDAEVIALSSPTPGSFANGLDADSDRSKAAAAPIVRTFRGTVSGNTISGTISGLGSFSTSLQPPSGPTAQISGLYRSNALNTAGGTTASIVGTQGQVLVVASTAVITTGGTGTVNTDGTFSVAATAATISGSVDAPTTTVSGTIVVPGQAPVPFSGLASSTVRTDRLINLSSRGRIAPATDSTLITGFVIGGSDSKRVLLRAVGPALTGYGVTGALSNPRLDLYDGAGKLILQNDDWSGTETATAIAQVGAFTLPNGSRDAALLATLQPGAYTMHVIDGGETGVALAEIYDASLNPQGEYQRLINISSRGTVGGGEGALIGGFIVTGNHPKKVLVRGVGPALTGYGLSNVLADPRLAIYSGSTLVAQNNDWSTGIAVGTTQVVATAAEISAAARTVSAFSYASNSKDAAVIVTLAPGAYTAQVTAADNTSTGVALVEIYELPE